MAEKQGKQQQPNQQRQQQLSLSVDILRWPRTVRPLGMRLQNDKSEAW